MSSRSRARVTFTQIAASLAIIAFVSAVLFPVFNKVRDGTGRDNCQAHMR